MKEILMPCRPLWMQHHHLLALEHELGPLLHLALRADSAVTNWTYSMGAWLLNNTLLNRNREVDVHKKEEEKPRLFNFTQALRMQYELTLKRWLDASYVAVITPEGATKNGRLLGNQFKMVY